MWHGSQPALHEARAWHTNQLPAMSASVSSKSCSHTAPPRKQILEKLLLAATFLPSHDRSATSHGSFRSALPYVLFSCLGPLPLNPLQFLLMRLLEPHTIIPP